MEINEHLDTIIPGDCIDILRQMPPESVDLIFVDPPYNMQTEGELRRTDGTTFNGITDKWDKFDSFQAYDTFCQNWLTECQRILKPTGSIWVIGSFQNIFRIGYIMQNLGFWILNDIIWSKPNAVPNFAGTRFQNSHETLIWCTKNKKAKFTFNYKTMKTLNHNKQMKSVWDIGICIGSERLKNANGNKVHSTQKPEKLLYNIILSSTKPGDIVLDPFFGAGTTGSVAKRLGRHYIGIEREEVYINYARQRIEKILPMPDIYSTLELEVKPPRISMPELMTLGYLSGGQTLYSKDKLQKVTLCDNGQVRSDDGITASIHKVSAHLLHKTNHNGWDYFWVYYKDKFVSINSLRYTENRKRNKAGNEIHA